MIKHILLTGSLTASVLLSSDRFADSGTKVGSADAGRSGAVRPVCATHW